MVFPHRNQVETAWKQQRCKNATNVVVEIAFWRALTESCARHVAEIDIAYLACNILPFLLILTDNNKTPTVWYLIEDLLTCTHFCSACISHEQFKELWLWHIVNSVIVTCYLNSLSSAWVVHFCSELCLQCPYLSQSLWYLVKERMKKKQMMCQKQAKRNSITQITVVYFKTMQLLLYLKSWFGSLIPKTSVLMNFLWCREVSWNAIDVSLESPSCGGNSDYIRTTQLGQEVRNIIILTCLQKAELCSI